MRIQINGYDFTDDVYELPVIDNNLPEWGQIEDGIINETLKLRLPEVFQSLFTDSHLNSHNILVTDDNEIIQFKGFIDSVSTTIKDITLNCKSETSVLFNTYLKSDDYAYVIDDAYPIDIINELLLLAGLKLNKFSYKKALFIQEMIDMTFSVTVDSINIAELLEKICDVTCGILYINNNEFHYEQFDPCDSTPSVDFDAADWIDYPVIDTPPVFGSVFNGADVTYGNNLALKGIDNASKKIDMSISSPIYTSNGITAQYVCDLYDYLGTHKKQRLSGSIRKNINNIITKQTYFKWNDVKYKLVNINNQSKIKTEIIGEAIL